VKLCAVDEIVHEFCYVQCADSTYCADYYKCSRHQSTSVVCKMLVPFTEHKINDFMKFAVCHEEIKTVR